MKIRIGNHKLNALNRNWNLLETKSLQGDVCYAIEANAFHKYPKLQCYESIRAYESDRDGSYPAYTICILEYDDNLDIYEIAESFGIEIQHVV